MAGLDASRQALAAARAALEVELDAFDRFAEAASMVMRDTAERRMAVVARARAATRRAMAFGWPLTAEEAPR